MMKQDSTNIPLMVELSKMKPSSNRIQCPNGDATTVSEITFCADMLRSSESTGDCIIYNFGVSREDPFLSHVGRFYKRCQVFAFDPTVSEKLWAAKGGSKAVFGQNVTFVNWGLYGGQGSRTLEWHHPTYGNSIGELKTFSEILHHFNHTQKRISLLRSDCEGCEWGWISAQMEEDPTVFSRIDQLWTELHFASTLRMDDTALKQSRAVHRMLWDNFVVLRNRTNPGFPSDQRKVPKFLVDAGVDPVPCCREYFLLNQRASLRVDVNQNHHVQISNWVGLAGNNILQLENALLYAELIDGIDVVLPQQGSRGSDLAKLFDLPTTIRVAKPNHSTRTWCSFPEEARNGHYGPFFWKGGGHCRPSLDEQARVFQQYLKGHLKGTVKTACRKAQGFEGLTVHLRLPPPKEFNIWTDMPEYHQPPCAFYSAIINGSSQLGISGYADVRFVMEQRVRSTHPCVAELVQREEANSSSLVDDVCALMTATSLVPSNSLFAYYFGIVMNEFRPRVFAPISRAHTVEKEPTFLPCSSKTKRASGIDIDCIWWHSLENGALDDYELNVSNPRTLLKVMSAGHIANVTFIKVLGLDKRRNSRQFFRWAQDFHQKDIAVISTSKE
jgi:hypothetical protein